MASSPPSSASPSLSRASSPCIKVCVMDAASGLCLGCGRSLDEIAAWGGMSEPARRAVMSGLPARLAGLKPKP